MKWGARVLRVRSVSFSGLYAIPNVCCTCNLPLPEGATVSENTCPACDKAFNHFDQDGLEKDEANDAKYYQGRVRPVLAIAERRAVFDSNNNN